MPDMSAQLTWVRMGMWKILALLLLFIEHKLVVFSSEALLPNTTKAIGERVQRGAFGAISLVIGNGASEAELQIPFRKTNFPTHLANGAATTPRTNSTLYFFIRCYQQRDRILRQKFLLLFYQGL